MDTHLMFKGRTYKQVLVTGTESATDDEVLDVALPAARESRSALFGWRVERHHTDEGVERAVVTMHTD